MQPLYERGGQMRGGAAHWLAVLRAVVVKELTILGRYPLEFVGAFLQIFLMVAVFTLAALMFVPADRTRGPEAASLGGTMVYGFVVFLFFIQTMWISGASLRREQKQGTLEQLYLSPAATSASLIARALVTTAFTGALALISLALMVALIGSLPAHNRALAGALLLLTLSGIFGAGFVFAALSLRLGETARVIATMAQFGFMIFCAPFFPFSVLPDWLRAVARLMPLAHSVDAFRSALMGFPPGHPELGPAPVGIAVVAAFGLLMPWLGLRFYRHCEEWARRNSYLTEH